MYMSLQLQLKLKNTVLKVKNILGYKQLFHEKQKGNKGEEK